MLKQISIQGFRGFRSFRAQVDPVTAFLGPNSSGKTTVLHAVRFACDMLQVALDSPWPPRKLPDGGQLGPDCLKITEDTLLGPAELLPLADWRAHFLDQEVGEGVGFSLQLDFAETDVVQTLWVQVSCARNQQIKLTVRVRSAAAVAAIAGLSSRSPLLNQRLTATIRAAAPVAVLVPPFYGTVPGEEYRARAVINRLLGSGDQSHVVRNLIAALEPDQYTRLNSFLRTTLGGTELTYRTTGDRLQTESPMVVHFKDTNGDMELSAAGAGLVNLVALFCALSRWRQDARDRPVIFLIDEPEAHLSPRLQADAASQLGRLVVDEFGAQLLVATHSVDILNRLGEQGAALVRCDRTAPQSAVPLRPGGGLYEDLHTWVDLTPYTAINFLASRRVLFCEGDGDQRALTRLAALRFRNDPVRLTRFRTWAIVQLKGASGAPIAPMLARRVRNDVVRAQAQAGGFSVVVVLDRDHVRTPGVTSTTDQGVQEVTLVWSRHSLESLLLEPATLEAWVRARVGSAAPQDLNARILEALREADADEELCETARQQLTAGLLRGELTDADGRVLGGDQKVIHAMRRAREQVAQEPAVWQRGKDRARKVLGALRLHIAVPARNQFPTDILRLLQDVDLNTIGDGQAAVPPEIGALLDRLAAG